jgi:2-oxoglutarate ferredoxin oxidoreductase subunit delta
VAKKDKTSIEIYKSWCKRCGICVAFCPAEALAQDDSGVVYVKDPERCTGCQLCELRCPDFAIHVRSPKKKKEKTSERTTEKIPAE